MSRFPAACDGSQPAQDGRPSPTAGSVALTRAWREDRVAVLASVARRVRDLQLAEDAVQEAYAAAVTDWPLHGVPDRPGAWLTTTAWRKSLDMLRRQRHSVPVDLSELTLLDGIVDPHLEDDPMRIDADDNVLALVLTCCHPALAVDAQVALTLRHVAGLTTREIAAAFLVPEATMSKRLVRARGKIRDAGMSFEMPDRSALPHRLTAVHTVIYLIFNEGYLASGDGPPLRSELCAEAVWLARQIHRLLPNDPETTGLLALLMLQHARNAARQDSTGELMTYDEQNRSLWDQAAITEAKGLLSTTGTEPPGVHQVQAAIALQHAVALSSDELNWSTIADLYNVLSRLAPSLVVDINRAVAIGRADGPQAGLAALDPALHDARLNGYLPLHAAHADLLERAGDPAALTAWRRAADLADNPSQRAQLITRAARLGAGLDPAPVD